MLVLAFLPAALVGLAFEDLIKQYLFGLWPIAIGWLVGGIVILIMPRRLGSEGSSRLHSIEGVDWRHAVTIGVFQVFAMWPGVSRSLATIVGGSGCRVKPRGSRRIQLLIGPDHAGRRHEPTSFVQNGPQVVSAYGIVLPVVGVLSSFLAAWVSVKWLVDYLQQHGLAVFGYYRIVLALLTAWLLMKEIL